jgi:hypothetical protein
MKYIYRRIYPGGRVVDKTMNSPHDVYDYIRRHPQKDWLGCKIKFIEVDDAKTQPAKAETQLPEIKPQPPEADIQTLKAEIRPPEAQPSILEQHDANTTTNRFTYLGMSKDGRTIIKDKFGSIKYLD